MGDRAMLEDLIRHPILAVRFAARRIKEIPSKGLPKLWKPSRKDDFDQRYGVETAKFVQIVPTDSPNFVHGTRYSPSPENLVRWSIENSGVVPEDTTFVDVGSGKGRALIVAAAYPFRRVVGIEYSQELVVLCRQNLSKLGIADRCEVVCADASEFEFPEENLLVFLYNPFDALILRRVLKHLSLLSAKVRIAQLGPGHDEIGACGFARTICVGDGPVIYEILTEFEKAS
jgi:SAM-dependent methyltransferase